MSAFGALQPFTQLTSKAVPIDIANCDTDQIIPARFLRRSYADPDYPRFLLHDLRFAADGTSKGFPLDQKAFKGGQIIVSDRNWGCGSSREAAVLALRSNSIRAVVAPSFGDIHFSNLIKNGILPVQLDTATCDAIRAMLHDHPGTELTINLENQTVTGPSGSTSTFALEPFDRHRLLHGLDDIGLTLEHDKAIAAFAQSYRSAHPWAD